MSEGSVTCNRCGSSSFEGAHFCVKCGASLDKQKTPYLQSQSVRLPPSVSRPSAGPGARPSGSPTTQRLPNAPPATFTPASAPLSEAFAKAVQPHSSPQPARSQPGRPHSLPQSKPNGHAAPTPSPHSNAASAKAPAGYAAKLEQAAALDMTLDEIDESLAALAERRSAPPPDNLEAAVAEAFDHTEAEDLFKQLAVRHLMPLQEFMVELEMGDVRPAWIDLCGTALSSLKRSSEPFDNRDLIQALDEMAEALSELPTSDGDPNFSEEHRSRLTEAYAALTHLLPSVPALDVERLRREPVLLKSLLLQVPDVTPVVLDRLGQVGLNRLSPFFDAKPSEIAEASGIELELARRIVARVAEYRDQAKALPPDTGRSAERSALRQLISQLEHQNEAFERAQREWSRDAQSEKRKLVKERRETMLRVNALLAQIGEVQLVKKLERLPFSDKAKELMSCLDRFSNHDRTL